MECLLLAIPFEWTEATAYTLTIVQMLLNNSADPNSIVANRNEWQKDYDYHQSQTLILPVFDASLLVFGREQLLLEPRVSVPDQ